jgi:osmotically-inducible protein OsmY
MKVRTLLFGGLIGAGVTYLLDPGAGTRRRKTLMNMANSRMNRGAKAAKHSIQRFGNVVGGAVPHAADNPNPDDVTLKDRIESEIFRNPMYSREYLNILVADGVVDVRGELPTQGDIDTVVSTIKAIPNVRGVLNYLHLPGTPAPSKEASLEVSR